MINQLSQSNNVNFLGYKTKFSKQLEKFVANPCPDPVDMMELSASMTKIVDKKIKPKYKMGEGKFHEVYRIDDYYVVRIPKEDKNSYVTLPRKPRKGLTEFFASFKTYVGNIVSEFGDYEIIKNAKGTNKNVIQAGVPYKMVRKFDKCKTFNDIDKVQEQINKEYSKKYLPAFSSLPQKAYDNVAADFVKLNDAQTNPSILVKMFDCNNPNNFIKVGNKIKIIDDLTTSMNYGNVSDMMHVFLKNYNTPDTPETLKMKKIIFKKCIIAATKNNMMDGFHKLGPYMKFVGINEKPRKFSEKILKFSQLPENKKNKEISKYLDTL